MSGAMSGPTLTRLLIRVRDAGLRLEVEGDALAFMPADKLTPGLREELLQHKPQLLELLTWRESVAHALLKDALAYLAEFYADDLDANVDAVNEAFYERDMFALRIAIREWVQTRVCTFKARQQKGTAA